MSGYLEKRREYARMRAAAELTSRHLRAIDAEIRQLAEDRAIRTVGGSTFVYHRQSTRWRPTHERAYRAHAAALQDRRAREIEALRRKLDRQLAALAAFRRRHGFNDED